MLNTVAKAKFEGSALMLKNILLSYQSQKESHQHCVKCTYYNIPSESSKSGLNYNYLGSSGCNHFYLIYLKRNLELGHVQATLNDRLPDFLKVCVIAISLSCTWREKYPGEPEQSVHDSFSA